MACVGARSSGCPGSLQYAGQAHRAPCVPSVGRQQGLLRVLHQGALSMPLTGYASKLPPHIVRLPQLPVPPTCMTPLPRESEAACDSGSCATQGGPLPMAPGPSNSDSQPSSHELRDHSLDRSRDEPPGPKKPRACLGVLYFNQRRYDAQKPPVWGQGGAGRCVGRVAGAPGGWRVAGVGRVGEEGGGRRS